MRFLPLIAATYFMVSGGPYGIEDILGGAGFAKAIVILLVLPFLWCLPTALMIGELASAIPAEGGFYIWVRRALGPFWGYQEGWLSLSASIFDMAIYPAIFVLYLGKFNPALTAAGAATPGRWPLSRSAAPGTCAARPPSAKTPSGCSCCCSRPLPSSLSSASGAGPRPSRHPMEPARLRGPLHSHPRGHVELHGLGQRLHRRAGSRESAAQLPPRHDRRDRPLVAVTYILPLAAMAWRPLSGQLLHRRLDHAARSIGGPCWASPSSPAEPSPASACSTRW
jgi:hypothetical protein